MQTRCIVKGEAQKSPLFWRLFWGFLIFSGSPVLQEFHKKTFKFNIKSPIFTNAPCKTACLYNAPSIVIFFFPYNPPPPLPRQTPRPSHPEKLDFGPFRLRLALFGSVSAPFGSVWLRFGSVLAPFRVRFGVLGGVGVGSGRGASVREKNITNLVLSSRKKYERKVFSGGINSFLKIRIRIRQVFLAFNRKNTNSIRPEFFSFQDTNTNPKNTKRIPGRILFVFFPGLTVCTQLMDQEETV